MRFVNVFWWRPTTDDPGYHGYRSAATPSTTTTRPTRSPRARGSSTRYVWHILAAAAPERDASAALRRSTSRCGRASASTRVTWHRLASCFLGIAAVLVIGFVGRRIGGNTVGIVAAAHRRGVPGAVDQRRHAAVGVDGDPHDGHRRSTPCTRSPDARRCATRSTWAWPCGITALSRTELTLLFPVVVIPLALLARGPIVRTSAVKHPLVAAGIVGVLVLLPWMIFNYTRFEEPTTMTSATGAALSAASCDETYYGTGSATTTNCFQGPWPTPSLDESQRDLVAAQAGRSTTSRRTSAAPAGDGRPRRSPVGLLQARPDHALDWWLEGRGRAPSWIGLFCCTTR